MDRSQYIYPFLYIQTCYTLSIIFIWKTGLCAELNS